MFSFDRFESPFFLCLGYLHTGDIKMYTFWGISAYFSDLFRQFTALPELN